MINEMVTCLKANDWNEDGPECLEYIKPTLKKAEEFKILNHFRSR